ncbi:MAG: META domain-containing protein [Leucobacter sp.]
MENLEEAVLGTWASDEKGNPFLKFRDDGRVTGSDGCNGLQGDYTVEDETVTIKRGASTLMACPGVDDWLGKFSSITVAGDTMTVFNEDGDEIGQLQRGSTQNADESPESTD